MLNMAGAFLNNQSYENSSVFGWAVKESEKDIFYGTSVDTFFLYLDLLKENTNIYFHNINNESISILYFLLNNCKQNKEKLVDKYDFTTMINEDNVIFDISFKNRLKKTIHFRDSKKLINANLTVVAKKYNEEFVDSFEPENIIQPHSELSQKAKDFLSQKVKYIYDIVDKAKAFLGKSTTLASASYNFFIKTLPGQKIYYHYPEISKEMWLYFKRAYYGGACFVKQGIENKEIGEGISYDVNSLYGYVMGNYPMPLGEPKYFEGRYEKDNKFPLYIQRCLVVAEIKKNALPSLIKKTAFLYDSPYTNFITSTKMSPILCYLTNADFEMLEKQYNIIYIKFLDGFKFRQCTTFFDEFLHTMSEVKIQAINNNDFISKSLSKFSLAMLSGKFGTDIERFSSTPYLDKNQKLTFTKPKKQKDKGDYKYIPNAIFTTSYARAFIIDKAQSNYDNFLYMDTDSLHLKKADKYYDLEIDEQKIGAFKTEFEFIKARFIREKQYIEIAKDGTRKIVCAGLQPEAYEQITFENFHANSDTIFKHKKFEIGLQGAYKKEHNFILQQGD